MNKRLPLLLLPDEALHNVFGRLGPVEYTRLAATCTDTRLVPKVQKTTDDINTIKRAMNNASTPCPTELILKYRPFAKGVFKDQLDDYIQSYINTKLPKEKETLFERLEEEPESNEEAKAAHTQDITTRVKNHPLLVFANVTDGHWKGWTPLHGAAYNGHTDIANLLLANGAEMDVTITHGPLEGATPLHWAALRGHTEIIQALLEAGADVNAKDKDDWTPLHGAAACGHKDIVKVLLQAGADPIVTDSNGKTPLQLATNDAIKALLQ